MGLHGLKSQLLETSSDVTITRLRLVTHLHARLCLASAGKAGRTVHSSANSKGISQIAHWRRAPRAIRA